MKLEQATACTRSKDRANANQSGGGKGTHQNVVKETF
jgi:hypothetical protein